MPDITQARVLILATDGFEQSELFSPREALMDAGAQVTLASIALEPIQGMLHAEKGLTITPDTTIDQVDADDFDALVLPGGLANPDALRLEPQAIALIQAFFDADKTVAAICHAPWLLVEADVLNGRQITSWPSLRTDLENAGADYVDKEVVIDGNLITSRKPDDLPAFNAALIEMISTQVSEAA
ncbi:MULTISPECIES: type 1 glutamine amidotransferase domain-containing protein [unclassified Sphingomonas]|uniref:type 1 glutamine amidotransferase domain-containing protein n=1 Tax=unclassified Sphingomonas TaxID=196159 RepID=UPI000BCF8D81|nr:MAG: peptidase C56 [Sphingomonas sp. 32-62-10]